MNNETPLVDSWCELAMHADVGAVLNLAKAIEKQLHATEDELRQTKEYANKLANGLLEGMLPRDVELLRSANADMASELHDMKNRMQQMFAIFDVIEVSDSGHEFHPTTISSCRVLDAQKLDIILCELKKKL